MLDFWVRCFGLICEKINSGQLNCSKYVSADHKQIFYKVGLKREFYLVY